MPRISTNPVDYFDKDAMLMVIGFAAVLRVCEFLCLGANIEGYRMNGKEKQGVENFYNY